MQNQFKTFSKIILIFLALQNVMFVGNVMSCNKKYIDLSGIWNFKIDSLDVGVSQKWYSANFTNTITLPGTTDDAGYGVANTLLPKLEKPQVLRLTRKNSYVGPAWYSKKISIPSAWANKKISLKLERVIWESQVWVDGKAVHGMQESLTTPHSFDLTNYLSVGEHTIAIRIDNRKKHDITVKDMAHAYTNETQIMWNGVIGEIGCIAEDKISISSVQIFPNVDEKNVKVILNINNSDNKTVVGTLKLSAQLNNSKYKLKSLKQKFKLNKDGSRVEVVYSMGNDLKLWDEFNPNIFSLTAEITGKGFASTKTETFGMRKITNKNSQLQINDKQLFLRGTLECAIFPLKGYPPMDKAGWKKVFDTARNWGLNHLRFHSWCPPKAAFEVADEMGFYLQIELPLWSLTVNQDQKMNDFLNNEADNIIREYGNHPSFCFWSIGNELQPDFAYLNSFVNRLKEKDKRHLYTCTSYTFEKGHGRWPEPNDDFFITQTTKKGWVRGQGIFDAETPVFNKDYTAAIDGIPVPIVTHEIGQYAVYPNLKEIEKYTGVLDPLNFKAVKADLEQKGLINKANDYLMASGKLAAILYKEEIERALKTKGMSGFQLLDLHDFPGQGTALVGLLDAFWGDKGLISADKFKNFCSPVVPLINYSKATYNNNETFVADVSVANFGNENLEGKELVWKVIDGVNTIKTGSILLGKLSNGLNTGLAKIEVALEGLKKATALDISVQINNSVVQNQWQIWVYPAQLKIEKADIVVTANYQEAIAELSKGKKVLFSPKIEDVKGLEGKFVQVFWSPVHFPDQPGTMGLLVNPAHPAFANFPTEMHTNWQWWDLCKKSKTICIDSIKGATPIVENVDNFMKNRRLCSVFEAKVGNGQLVFSSMDLLTDVENRIVVKQLLFSILAYVKSEKFSPLSTVSELEIKSLLQ